MQKGLKFVRPVSAQSVSFSPMYSLVDSVKLASLQICELHAIKAAWMP